LTELGREALRSATFRLNQMMAGLALGDEPGGKP